MGSRFCRTKSRVWLLILGALFLAVWATNLRSPGAAIPKGGSQDQNLHTTIISRIGSGETYYDAMGQELRARGYPSASIFNWRTPLLAEVLSLNPNLGRLVLVALGGLVLTFTVIILSRDSPLVTLPGAIVQAGAIGVVLDPTAWMFHEVWAGLFVALSVFAYAKERWKVAVLLGLVAMFIRELAAPFVLVCLCLAVWGRRRREVALWILGLGAYSVYYGWHIWQVGIHQRAGDVSHASSWLSFGGLSFISTTLRTNGFFYDAPSWVAAFAVMTLVAGTLSRSLAIHVRGTVLAYLMFFAIVGQPFNWYWNWIPGFLAPLVFAHGVAVLRDLASGAWR